MKFITPLILILSSVGLFMMYINPQYAGVTGADVFEAKSIKELKQDILNYDDALQKTRDLETIRTGLSDKFKSVSEKQRERLIKLLPDHIDSVRLIIDMNGIAASNGTALSGISLSTKSSGAGPQPSGTEGESGSAGQPNLLGPQTTLYDSVELSFSTSGSYEEFLSLVRDLETSLRIVDIISINISEGDEIYTFGFSIRTYRLK
ncbi:MAG: hypothetical protein Q8P52_03060 [bacterium]|nr:hypothetical protein [bacterium]